ncbi:MAG: N-acetyl-gamma-glutamyl-phosphate reductase [bacterium]|nr:N-acetyl-gamma-glutamyl-phosphate reductase [bacterium]
MVKVFIDGKSGTTGLKIFERFSKRNDIELLEIKEELRKDPIEKQKIMNNADIVFLCLPDDAAIESAKLVTNPNTVIIDTSTAHRTDPDWAYGFPELDKELENKINNSKRIAVPGCYASGFLSIVYPLVKLGVIDKYYQISANAISGYSGAGKKGIEQYKSSNDVELEAPRLYGMSQNHKHLKEMMAISGLDHKPLFNPYVCNFYSGMIVDIPLEVKNLKKKVTPKELYELFKNYYGDNNFVRVMPFNENGTESGFLSANHLSGKDYLEIYISGNDERINVAACLDNLGKGASGAAVEVMNMKIGKEKEYSLEF